jgi:hypothetical protein
VADTDLAALAAEAYVYGFPLVFNLDQVERFVTRGLGSNPPAPFNQFSHARHLAGPAETFVSINNDTIYSIAQVDLSVGPVRLRVPDTVGRYYVLQFVDAWTNNFAYVGHRATGTLAAEFLLAPPGLRGHSDGVTVIKFPTRVGTIVGRWACEGADDLPEVHALQDATELRAVNENAIPEGLPGPGPVPGPLQFLEKLRVWSQAFPPAPRDQALQERLAPIGTAAAGRSPYISPAPEFQEPLIAGLREGETNLRAALRSGVSSERVNGWHQTLHVFDYNLDYFEVGAVDDDRFKLTDPTERLVTRAGAAMGGLWGNHAYEAAYIMTYVDDRGEELNGENTYTLRLSPTPPVSAFWSLTMYTTPDFYLVDNEIDRYSIGDRTPGIIYDCDGGLTITMSRHRPADPAAAANWLPTPSSAFRPILRMYEPGPAVLDGSYVVPAIMRA